MDIHLCKILALSSMGTISIVKKVDIMDSLERYLWNKYIGYIIILPLSI